MYCRRLEVDLHTADKNGHKDEEGLGLFDNICPLSIGVNAVFSENNGK
jgi:hypothetical protein